MKKKMTFYIEEEIEEKLIDWLHKHNKLTGKKLTKTSILNMLLKSLLNNDES